ncbi:MAG TPA: glutamate--tRNA ligase family protein, partial [Vicingus sp.]|nr:glutamate--tRNA ligase family protein [Vicingus sp.]
SSGYRESGYFPNAVINMLALLGWNPGTEQELFTVQELVDAFSLDKVGKSGSKFDPEKTKWFNEQYLRAKSNEELAQLIKPLAQAKGYNISNDAFLIAVCNLMKERATFLNDIIEKGTYFFEAPATYDAETAKIKWKDESAKIVTDLITIFSNTAFNAHDLEAAFKKYVEDNSLGFGVAMIAIRLSITGVGGGPHLFDIMEVIGKEESINRLKSGIEKINKG